MSEEYFQRDNLESTDTLTVTEVIEHDDGTRTVKMGENDFMYHIPSTSRFFNYKVGDKIKRNVYNMIYKPTGRRAIIQDVEYLPIT